MPDCRSAACRSKAVYMVAQFRKPTKDTTKNYREPVWAGWFCRQHLHRCLVVKLDDLMINNYIKVKKVVP